MIKHKSLRHFALICIGCFALLACQSGEVKPTPSTPYSVGVRTQFIHDVSRPYDAVAGVNVGARSLLTEIWYPVEHAVISKDQQRTQPQFPAATFGDYVFGKRDVHQKMMAQTTFFHLTPETVIDGVTSETIQAAIDELFERTRASFRDAPIADTPQGFPVVLMTHGDAGSRYNMETACEWLAAHGYIVIAPEHTGSTPFALTGQDPALKGTHADTALVAAMQEVGPLLNSDGTYGDVATYGQTYAPLGEQSQDAEPFKKLDQSLVERVNDLRTALSYAEKWNNSGWLKGQAALDQVGVMGRSFGGMTTLAALGIEDRFAAGVAVVPLVLPDIRNAFPEAITALKGTESVLFNQTGGVAMNTLTKPTLLLSGAEDTLIINAGRRMHQAFGGPEPSATNPHPVLRQSFEQSTAPAYWGLLQDSNHSSFGVSGGYWWPELKPTTQKRTFNPEETFTLIEPEKAHDIQKERVLTFFDAYLKDSPEAFLNFKAKPQNSMDFDIRRAEL